MSGNGDKYDYEGLPLSLFTAPYNLIPPDQGGGCVTEGPFKTYVSLRFASSDDFHGLTWAMNSMSVNLGPVFPGSPTLNVPPNPQADGLGYNPRTWLACSISHNFTHIVRTH